MSDPLRTDLVSRLRAGIPHTDPSMCKLVMDEAADEIERLETERDRWHSVAGTRNVNIVLIAEERDRLRATLEAIAAFPIGEFRPLADEIAIHKQAVDALKHPDVPQAQEPR